MISSNSLLRILRQYASSDDKENWVAATVVDKQRSSYRNPGALMLVSPLGKSLGLVSGGCLEADVVLQARRVLAKGNAAYVIYDSTKDGNIAADLGLGCNGRVGLLVQELTPAHRVLMSRLRERLEQGRRSFLLHCCASDTPSDLNSLILLDENIRLLECTHPELAMPKIGPRAASTDHLLIEDDHRRWSLNLQRPPVNLWVIGGGLDAESVVTIADMLGWRVTLADHRTSYARISHFPAAQCIVRSKPGEFTDVIDADAAIVMSHNLQMDADWLLLLQDCKNLKYVGLLGPQDRKAQVLEMAALNPISEFSMSVRGPMGIDIGGELPESIALSAIAECHQVLARDRLL